MKLLTSILFASVFVYVASLTCKVGDDYRSRSSVSNIGGYWYLNVEVPATCSGSIDQYKLRYYDDSLNENEYYYATLAIWRPTGGGSYEKDNNTMLSYSFHFDDKRRKRNLNTERPDLSSLVGVRKGSVIGVYLGTSNPIQAIGETSDNSINNVPIGVCRTAVGVSAITIDCSNGSNIQDQILHAEAEITVVDCGNVPNVTNAISTLVDGDTQYGATVQYNCSIGYIPIGNSTITCPLSGSWPTPLTCTIVECYEPEPLVNGQIYTIGNDFTYGSTVTFSCDTGYELQGNETALCQANGQWSSNIPLCSIIDCPDPGTPNNGHRNSSNFSYGASISFTCNVGYELSGNSVIVCEGNKKWSGLLPTCNITYCNDPGVPENGFASPSNFSYGTIVLFQCNIGYELSGSANITCQADNNWDNNLPTCTLVTCPNPITPVNGYIEGSLYTLASVIIYHCNPSYYLEGNNTAQCQVNKTWTINVPTCLKLCNDPGTPNNSLRVPPNIPLLTEGLELTFYCITGYTLQGTSSITCLSSGQWSHPVPICVPNCSDPGTPDHGSRSNGQLNGDNFNYSSIVTYLCDNGFALHGSKTLTCLTNGTWSGSVPICNPINCSDPGVPLNGHRIGENFTFSSSVMYMCSTGYNLIGHSALTCKGNGSWDGPVPTCETVTCSNPSIPSNGHKIGKVYSYNSSVFFYCNTGYNLIGSNRLTCLANGSWDVNIPVCDIVNCGNPGTFNNGQINGLQYTYGSQLTFICNNGYTLQGASSITCLSSGQWSETVPICVPDCSDPGTPDHGSRSPVYGPYNNGTTVSFLCNDGYKLNNVSSIMCVSGQWNGNVPQCISSIPTSQSDNTNTETVIYSSTPAPSGQLNDKETNNKGIMIGVIVGVSLIFIILIIIIIILVTLFVWRLHHRTGKMIVNPKDSGQEMSAITNPMMFIPDLYDLATPKFFEENIPYEVPVQTLHNPITSKSHPGNLNEDDIYTALEDIESNEKGLYEQEDNDNTIEGELPSPLYFTLDQCVSTESTSIEGGIPQPLYFILEKDTATPQPVYFTLERTSTDENMTTNTTLSQTQQPIYFTLEPSDHRSSNEGGNNQQRYFTLNQPGRRTCDEGGNNQPHYFTLDQTRHATGINKDSINQSLYFTLDQTGHCTGDESAVKHSSRSTLNQVGKRKTMIYQQPGENEDELYGQIKKSHVASLSLNDLQLGDTIGTGQFGNVQKAVWQKSNGESIEVAVKTLQEGSSEKEKIKFLQEAVIMSQFNHANVIKLYGVVADDNLPMIVVEYMPKGDLRSVVYKFRPDPGELANSDVPILLLSFSRQICLGMTYLSEKGFVHRDLAARNILVSADNICKIIDFGLSRDLEDENYYVSHKGAMIPVRWTAPEALNYRKYSTASDVWSYGCLLYEIWSLGHKPYEKFSNIQALEKICSDYRLPPPPGCSKTIYNIMMTCWNPNTKERPTFNDIMLLLLQNDKTLLAIPEDALSTHPQAGVLGATLKAGEQMYMDIQSKYMDIMDTAL